MNHQEGGDTFNDLTLALAAFLQEEAVIGIANITGIQELQQRSVPGVDICELFRNVCRVSILQSGLYVSEFSQWPILHLSPCQPKYTLPF